MFYKLDFLQAQELICKAAESSADDLMIYRWVQGGYEKQGMPYADFKARLTSKPDNRTAEDIDMELEAKMSGLTFAKHEGGF